VIAALVFLLNPSTLYIQSTPMTELPLMGLAIIAIYYAVRWARTFDAPHLVKCAAATAGATLVRYDAWALAGALCVILLAVAWRGRGRQSAEANALLYGTLALSGCVAWLIYQQIIVGNAFDFLSGPYSSAREQQELVAFGRLPTLHNPLLSLQVYAQVTLDTINWPMMIVALIGVALWVVRSGIQTRMLPVYALFIPFVFNWYSLMRGNSALETPEFAFGGIRTFYNVRYGLMMLPAIALFFAYAASRIRWSLLPSAALLATVAIQGTAFATPYALQDPLVGMVRPDAWQHQEVAWFTTHCARGTTLISESTGGFESVIFYSHIPLSHFITNTSSIQFEQALAHPEAVANCLALDSQSANLEPVWQSLHNRQDWRPYFKLAAQFGTASFYERIDQHTSGGTSPPVQAAVISQRSVIPGGPSQRNIPAQGDARERHLGYLR
ncbi:MAG TPA: hypothetical protein VGR57_13355, partial [Ktedonobacterales bacterium]|nr:hypothetical protein [Ktedonobacterales bacterium]